MRKITGDKAEAASVTYSNPWLGRGSRRKWRESTKTGIIQSIGDVPINDMAACVWRPLEGGQATAALAEDNGGVRNGGSGQRRYWKASAAYGVTVTTYRWWRQWRDGKPGMKNDEPIHGGGVVARRGESSTASDMGRGMATSLLPNK